MCLYRLGYAGLRTQNTGGVHSSTVLGEIVKRHENIGRCAPVMTSGTLTFPHWPIDILDPRTSVTGCTGKMQSGGATHERQSHFLARLTASNVRFRAQGAQSPLIVAVSCAWLMMSN